MSIIGHYGTVEQEFNPKTVEGMVNNEQTLQQYGYSYDSLTNKSNKKIVVTCDYCYKDVSKTKKQRVNSNEVLNKDACQDCRYLKMKELCKIKYGVDNVSKTDNVKKKISQSLTEEEKTARVKKKNETMLEKYGDENAMRIPRFKEKARNTLVNNYGVENPSQSTEIRDKIKQCNREKYGCDEFMSTGIPQAAFKEKYGVDNPFQLEEIKERAKQTCVDKYGVEHHLKDKERAAKHGRNVLASKVAAGQVKLYDGKPISDYVKESGFSDSHFRVLVKQYGFDEALKMTPRVSSLEVTIESLLIKHGIKYKKVETVAGYKPDFILECGLIIEVDGLYWHCEKVCEDDKYHFNKKAAYTAAGHDSVFFREDELREKVAVVESIILNKCGLSKRVFARKCEVAEINPTFFSINHLMGKGFGVAYGLVVDGEIVAGIQLRRIKGDSWEVSRFCNKIGVSVVGGFSKLLKYFTKKYVPISITTFIDMRYGTGGYLPDLGFKEVSTHVSFKWTNCVNTYPRTRFLSNTGYEKGLVKIWDCGQKKFVLSNSVFHNESKN